MALAALIIIFLFFLLIGAPVAVAIGLGSLAYLVFAEGIQFSIVPLKMMDGLDSFPLLALPFFVLTGELMNTAGITRRIFNFASLLVGHIRGGLGHVNIVASMIFAGMSGSAIADTAGLGTIEIKAMTEAGYDPDFSAAVTAASSTIGPIIPPSIMMVLYAVMADVPTGALFLGGIVPGVVMGFTMMVFVYFMALRRNYPLEAKATPYEVGRSFLSAFPALMTPAIIMAGIITGVVTPTEAGVMGSAYALLLGLAYREIGLSDLPKILQRTMLLTAQVMFILSCATLFGWLVITEQIPERLSAALLAVAANKYLLLLIFNLALLFLGCFMSITAVMIIVTPMMVGLAQQFGIDLIHLGVIMVLNLTIGLITPPVGWCLYIVSDIAQISFERTVRATLPFLIPLLVSLAIITYIPWTVTYMAGFLMGRSP